jgi:hypothetical protein
VPNVRLGLIVAQAWLGAGCGLSEGSREQVPSGPIYAPAVAFSDVYELTGTVTPEHSEGAPIITVSGALLTDDRVVIVDVSQANAKVFDRRSGRLLQMVGRKGEGPGEFQRPRYAALDGQGRLHVADVAQARISVWNQDGSLDREFGVPVSSIGSLSLLRDGSYILSTLVPVNGDSVLVHVDSLGAQLSSSLPIGSFLPSEADPSLPWRSLRGFSATLQADSVFTVATIADSLWVLDLVSGAISARQIVAPGYEAPINPEERPRGPEDLMAWGRSFYTTAPIHASEGTVIIPFVKGVLNFGDPLLLVTRDPSGRWATLLGAPPIVAAHKDELLAIHDPLADELRLAIYKRKP